MMLIWKVWKFSKISLSKHPSGLSGFNPRLKKGVDRDFALQQISNVEKNCEVFRVTSERIKDVNIFHLIYVSIRNIFSILQIFWVKKDNVSMKLF